MEGGNKTSSWRSWYYRDSVIIITSSVSSYTLDICQILDLELHVCIVHIHVILNARTYDVNTHSCTRACSGNYTSDLREPFQEEYFWITCQPITKSTAIWSIMTFPPPPLEFCSIGLQYTCCTCILKENKLKQHDYMGSPMTPDPIYSYTHFLGPSSASGACIPSYNNHYTSPPLFLALHVLIELGYSPTALYFVCSFPTPPPPPHISLLSRMTANVITANSEMGNCWIRGTGGNQHQHNKDKALGFATQTRVQVGLSGILPTQCGV